MGKPVQSTAQARYTARMSIPRRAFLLSPSLLRASAPASAATPMAASLAGSNQASQTSRVLGVTVMPEYIQSEGVDGIIANLKRIGASAVATSPYVMEPADQKTGSREPPADAGAGNVRLLDRPLWGQLELFVRTAPSFEPDRRLYAGLRYQPPQTDGLTRAQGGIIHTFVKEAKAAGLKVYLQFQAAIPPGYRVQFGGATGDDIPRLPDGSIPPRRVDKNGSLASVEIRRYTNALIRDLLRVYPDVDGIRPDWPEYPPYLLDSAFLDFSPPTRNAALQMGYSWERMQSDAGQAYRNLLGSLTNADLEQCPGADGGRFALLTAMADRPGVAEWLGFKAQLVNQLLEEFRRTLTEAGGGAKELVPNAFPPPFTAVSGFHYARAAAHSASISVKLYTMHWPMMLRFYGDALLAANPGLSAELLGRTLAQMMDIDENPTRAVNDYTYPPPDVPHPVSEASLERKIQQARHAAGATPINALAHGYGPKEDFAKRLRVAWKASGGRVWVNRYAYLTDEKLDLIRELTKA